MGNLDGAVENCVRVCLLLGSVPKERDRSSQLGVEFVGIGDEVDAASRRPSKADLNCHAALSGCQFIQIENILAVPVDVAPFRCHAFAPSFGTSVHPGLSHWICAADEGDSLSSSLSLWCS